MAFLYVTRTIALPVRASGMSIIDNNDQTIATVAGQNYFTADALADLINLGEGPALGREAEYERQERKAVEIFTRARAERAARRAASV